MFRPQRPKAREAALILSIPAVSIRETAWDPREMALHVIHDLSNMTVV